MVSARPGRARRRAARYALLAAFVWALPLAIAHGTYVLAAGVAVTVWVARRPPGGSDGGAPSKDP